MSEKYHFVYKTVNLLDNSFYIGIHSTLKINDGYLGSGRLLNKQITKFGRHNFKREILHFCSSRKEAIIREAEIVNYDMLNNELCYNLILGGNSGIKTTPLKKLMFAVNVIRNTKYEVFDKKHKYSFEINQSVYSELQAPIVNASEWMKSIYQYLLNNLDRFLSTINICLNNKFEHSFAIKAISKLDGRIKKTKWQDQANTQRS